MAMLLQLLVHRFPVRLRSHLAHRDGLAPEQLGFQFFFAPTLWQGPTDTRGRRSFQILVYCAQSDPTTASDRALP
jgi:hypothetical protein